MKITTLVENSAGDKHGTQPEFGLSQFIETNGKRILLDTGSTGLFLKNAAALNIDIASMDLAVLSHGHFDHGGGLETFLNANSKAKVYIHPLATGDYYGTLIPRMPDTLKRKGVLTRKIGINRQLVENNPGRFVKVEKNLEALGGVWIIPEISRTRPLASGNRFLFERTGNSFTPDRFGHEMILAVSESDGVVVFSGCAHNGIMNMISTVKEALGNPRIKSVVGGFHLSYPKSERSSESVVANRELAEELGRVVDGPILTGHCTGSEAFTAMKKVLGDRLVKISSGSMVVV